jgi:AhpD family alkylhydroperoxidase
MIARYSIYAAALACLVSVVAPEGVLADEAEAAYEDMAETYGSVPGFFRLFPPDDVADVWYRFRTLQLNPDIAMDATTRELIGVAVATQGPCRPCVYFHAAAALANGASKEEIREAVGVGAATRRLNAAFNDVALDIGAFTRETDLLLWGDAKTITLRGPQAGFCAFIIDWAGADYVGCD